LGQVAWSEIDQASTGLSHAEITLAAERAAKDAILAETKEISTTALLNALKERHAGSRA
jgi:predicted mannosyl-3-phosphoglycerate phosphatase (HAD superfamily)